ncbi:MAG TPA: hypothetical protein VEJ63_00765 [Planctomycetota bacterium]|nr:hypothetical protein [Planctomycetota bacterium]
MNEQPHTDSWWLSAPPSNFTWLASAMLQAPVMVDDVIDRETQVIVQRHYVHETLIGLRENTQTFGVLSANVVSRN